MDDRGIMVVGVEKKKMSGNVAAGKAQGSKPTSSLATERVHSWTSDLLPAGTMQFAAYATPLDTHSP